MSLKCSWCNRFIGKNQYWYHNVTENGKEYKSKEIFCSPKCSHNYPHRATPDKPNYLSGCLILILFLVAGAFFVNSGSDNNPEIIDESVEKKYEENNTLSTIVDDTINSNDSEVKSVEFYNKTVTKAFLAYAFFNDSEWESHGWYEIKPNGSTKINLPISFSDDSLYWYAVDENGSEWVGSDRSFCVDSTNAFDYFGNNSENCLNSSKSFYKLKLNGSYTSQNLID